MLCRRGWSAFLLFMHLKAKCFVAHACVSYCGEWNIKEASLALLPQDRKVPLAFGWQTQNDGEQTPPPRCSRAWAARLALVTWIHLSLIARHLHYRKLSVPLTQHVRRLQSLSDPLALAPTPPSQWGHLLWLQVACILYSSCIITHGTAY